MREEGEVADPRVEEEYRLDTSRGVRRQDRLQANIRHPYRVGINGCWSEVEYFLLGNQLTVSKLQNRKKECS